jgi:hypothetical protein
MTFRPPIGGHERVNGGTVVSIHVASRAGEPMSCLDQVQPSPA